MNLETNNKIPNPCGNMKEIKMKNSGVEWIGEIPEDWDVKPLKTLFSFGKGLPITKENLVEKGLPVISYGQIHSKSNTGTKLQSELLRYVSNSYLDSNPNSLVHSGDFIFADTSEDLEGCGNCCYIDNEIKLFAGYHTIILQSKISKDNKYLAYLFKTDEWRKQLREKLVEVKLYSITQKALKSTSVILPPKPTQQCITAYLDKKCSKVEETIQNQQQVIGKLKAYKQSLITEAVTGKIKIQNGNACGKYEEYKDSGVEWIGKIPSKWKAIKAKYFIKISNGSDPKTEEGDTPVYGSGAESFKTCVEFKDGPTVLIGRKGATLHIPHYIEGNYWNVDTAFDVKTYSEEALLLKFYYYCATVFDYKFYLTSTTLPSMTQTNYGNMYLPVPNTQTQKEIVEFLNNKCTAIDTVIEQKQELIVKLTEYKKSLIYECVTGKKEI